ncbi:MAG: hypothetical protein GEU71_14665 [Actinobacteria bacterium]|nr:hypothetical protein [Actinomycetota bacterium]
MTALGAELAARSRLVLTYIKAHPGCYASEIRLALGLTAGQVGGRLNALRAENQIRHIGTETLGRYVVGTDRNPKMRPFNTASQTRLFHATRGFTKPKPDACPHHYIVESPNGNEELLGVCRVCGKTRTFPATGDFFDSKRTYADGLYQ